MFGQLHQQSPEFKKGELITSLTAEKLQKDAKDFADTALISDVSLITSFNWLGKTTNPTMLIPGLTSPAQALLIF